MANVCSKGGVEYATVNEAIKAEGQEAIKLLIAVSEDVVVPQRRYATIDLNGQTLTCVASHAITVENKATVTITDSADGGTVDSIITGKAALYVMPGGSATVEDGKLTRSKEDSKDNTWYVIQNQGSLVITGNASISNSSTLSSAVENGFDSTRQADADAFATMGDSEYVATLSLDGGTITSNVLGIKNDEHSTLVTNGGKIVAKTQPILNWTYATINGGTFNSSGSGVVVSNGTYNGSAGSLAINGGQFNTLIKTDEIVQALPSYESEDIVITGGDFAKAPAEKYCAPGVAFITDSKGRVTVSRSIWRYPDGGAVGLGFNGLRRLVMKAETVAYPTGGIDIPMGFDPVGILGVSMQGGAMGYIDRANRKVLLYTANGKEASGNISDVSIVLIGH